MKRVLDDLQVFCAVVEFGNFKQAANRLGIPHSTVSRRIDALEKNLGLHLLHRSTREVSVTHRGKQLYDDCAPMLDSLALSVAHAIEDEVQFNGALSVSMPVRAGLDFLGDWLIDFAAQYPNLRLSLALTNVNQNLIQDNIDVAFRVGPLVDSSAIALPLWEIPYTLVASKDFVTRHKIANSQIDLAQFSQLPAVISQPARKWSFTDNNKQSVALEPDAQLIVDDLALAQYAVESGGYLGFLPKVMLTHLDLVHISVPDLVPRTRTMFAYYLGKRHSISQIKHLVSYIKQRYSVDY